jgi:hypothetical protein
MPARKTSTCLGSCPALAIDWRRTSTISSSDSSSWGGANNTIDVTVMAVSVALKRNAQCKPKLVKIGGQQLGGIIGHAG